jgi:protein-L-isoaspartate(D-aspartate) O-methyltransferase
MKAELDGIGMTSRRTRARLVERLRGQGIRDERVLAAIAKVPRHVFIEEALAHRAYEDCALPIGFGQTISQPFVVALMTQALFATARPRRVLEIGTGSGYQTAVLAELAETVYSVERLEPLLKLARRRLRELGYRNIQFRLGDGAEGWSEHAPYDAILVAAAPREVPPPLIEQLAESGALVIPVGEPARQELVLIRRTERGLMRERLDSVTFVPLIRDEKH